MPETWTAAASISGVIPILPTPFNDRGEVDDRAWEQFVERAITPALPDGFTVFDAAGAWKSPATGRTTRERTKVLLVALPDTPDSTSAVQRVRDAYQSEFHQQLVGMTAAPACGSF